MQLVERREDLPNAIALNSTMFNTARFLGPTLAGVLIAVVGEGLCFSLDSVSYLAVIAALLMMVVQPRPPHKQSRHFVTELKEGLNYATSFLPIRALLTNLAIVTLCGIQYMVLMPAFARDVLHGDSRLQGILMGASGFGAAVGGILLASRSSLRGLGRIIPMASAGLGVALIAFGASQNRYVSVPILALIGFCMITQTAASNTLLQSVADDDKRGRIMSLFAMSFQGTMPLGSLMAGELARPDRLGPGRTIMVAGLGCLLAALLFARQLKDIRRLARPILEQRGMLGVGKP
jgi:MFS family permease